MKKLTKTALRKIADSSRQMVGRIVSDAALTEALDIVTPRFVDEAGKAGMKDANRIVAQARKAAKVDKNHSPRAKLEIIVEAIITALYNAWKESVEKGNGGNDGKNDGRVGNLKVGKRGELLIMSRMLVEGFNVYAPMVDDHGVDAVVRWKNGPFLQVQIKATGKGILWPASFDTGGLPNGEGFFVFHSEEWKTMWVMLCEEVRQLENKPGVITFSAGGLGNLRPNPSRRKFEARNFDRLKQES